MVRDITSEMRYYLIAKMHIARIPRRENESILHKYCNKFGFAVNIWTIITIVDLLTQKLTFDSDHHYFIISNKFKIFFFLFPSC